jgi:hypothetical protein
MKTVKLNSFAAGALSACSLMMAAPGVSSAAGENGLDIHGWRIDTDIHGWRIDHAPVSAPRVAASRSPYVGTSLRVEPDGLGFSDPRPGQGDFESGAYVGTSLRLQDDSELGFSDPRAGQGDY